MTHALRLYWGENVISLIVATGLNGEIGKDNKLLWNIPEEMNHFVKYTKGKSVVMGRKTYESIGKPLPNRTNYILTTQDIEIPGCIVIHSIDDIKNIEGDVVIIGGAEIYKACVDIVHEMVISRIPHFYPFADSHFLPSYDNFEVTAVEDHTKFSVHTYTRR